MRILTYFGFTLLSVLIQFCVMDYIQERLHLGEKPADLNATSPKKQLSDVLKDVINKPHALYYSTHAKRLVNTNNLRKNVVFSNSSLPELLLVTTDTSSSILDVFYDENTSIAEGSFTTDSMFTSTELDNVTEIALFENKNQTTTQKTSKPKIILNKDCHCNFLFKTCDINCCCDNDCSDTDRELFNCLEDNQRSKELNTDVCYSHLLHNHNKYASNIMDSLFCIVKTNLPDKRHIKNEIYDQRLADHHLKWRSNDKTKITNKFTKKLYKNGDPIWLLKNGSIYQAELPFAMINNYCTARKPIIFFKDEKIICNVKLNDLEMFHTIKTTEETYVISPTNVTMNSSALNCSTLYCINWTVIACEVSSCMHYNTSLHEPLCTESICTNLAPTVDYIFYYYDSKIINATIKLYIQNIPTTLPFISQEINVRFLIANESIEKIIEFSGSQGYVNGLPVIASFAESNYTDNFYKRTMRKDNYLSLPGNNYGLCILTNITSNYIQFGYNKRIKCRYAHKYKAHNLDACKDIQSNISNLFGISNKIVVSPYGNPQTVKDEDWIPMDLDAINKEPTFGQIDMKSSELHCYHFFTRMSFVFTFANVNKEGNRILSAKCEVTARNKSFNIEDISTVITVDINFIDVTKPGVFEYAGRPHLNIHLPKDFFFPYPSNESHVKRSNMYNVILYCCIYFICK